MTTVTASAPGKVVLCGEYAVLDGAPAVAMAVDRRAVARVTCPGPGRGPSGGDDRLLECAAQVVLPEALETCGFDLDTRGFVDEGSGVKLGIGSSAALTVALVAALARQRPGNEARPVVDVALAAHAAFQGGLGSGVDVATCASGGIIEFDGSNKNSTPIAWPAELHYALLWSGTAASTTARIARVTRPSPARELLADRARAAVSAWRSSAAAAIVTALRDYITALANLDREYGLDIFAAGHEALCAQASADSIVYKPCGAGGGDIGIVLGTDRAQVAAFVEQAQDRGFVDTKLRVDWHGVAVSGVP